MPSNSRMAELLLETGAYKDLDKPVILTSGQLGIFYINAERLVQDGGAWEQFGDDSAGMINHAVRMSQEHPTFNEVINVLSEDVNRLLPRMPGQRRLISGGQRRDWLFSGPVAYKLGFPHISLYKDGNMTQVSFLGKNAHRSFYPLLLNNSNVAHVADLITEGSSVYRVENEIAHGWVSMIRRAGGNISNLVAVVSRLQGGEEMLAEQRVKVESFVQIDESFLRAHSKQPEQAIAYLANPTAWSQAYLREHGALALVNTFNPNGGKLDRARKFMARYETTLQEAGRLEELRQDVINKFGADLK